GACGIGRCDVENEQNAGLPVSAHPLSNAAHRGVAGGALPTIGRRPGRTHCGALDGAASGGGEPVTILAADVQGGQPGAAAREELRQPARDYGSYGELLEAYFQAGWTDGLPIVPPTPEKVAAFLEAGHMEPGRIVGSVPTREITVSAEQVAINAI